MALIITWYSWWLTWLFVLGHGSKEGVLDVSLTLISNSEFPFLRKLFGPKRTEGWVDNIAISHNNLTNFVITPPWAVSQTLQIIIFKLSYYLSGLNILLSVYAVHFIIYLCWTTYYLSGLEILLFIWAGQLIIYLGWKS